MLNIKRRQKKNISIRGLYYVGPMILPKGRCCGDLCRFSRLKATFCVFFLVLGYLRMRRGGNKREYRNKLNKMDIRYDKRGFAISFHGSKRAAVTSYLQTTHPCIPFHQAPLASVSQSCIQILYTCRVLPDSGGLENGGAY